MRAMAARDNVNPHQLAMLMTAQELHEDIGSIDVQTSLDSRFGGAWRDKKSMWKTKGIENRADKFNVRGGVHTPVEVTHGKDFPQGGVLRDGHHRVHAAFRQDPGMLVPVEHTDFDKEYGY